MNPTPAPQSSPTPAAGMEVVLHVASAQYRCTLGAGCEVARVPAVTAIPGSPNWLRGLCVAREQVVPVVELARVLGVGEAPDEGARERLVTLREAGLCVGFVVDDVHSGAEASGPHLDLVNVAGALVDRLRQGQRRQ